MEEESRHKCFIYEGSPSLQLPVLANMILQKLNDGHRCMYLNGNAMVAGMRSTLAALGLDVVGEIAKGGLVMSSDSILSDDGSFDVEWMLNNLESAVKQSLSDGYKGLWATGDMTWEFGSEKNFEKLLEYEYKLEKLFRKQQALGGICQYHKDTLPEDAPRKALLTHRSVFINETVSRISPFYVDSELVDSHSATDVDLDKMIAKICQGQKKRA